MLLVLAAALGLLSLAPGMDQIYLLIPLLAAFTAAIDIGGNATSAAVTTALTVLDRRATLMSALARSLASVVGGVLAAAVGWTGAVWAIFVCAVLTWATLRRRQRHPTDNAWVEGSHETLRLILVPGTDVDRGPASFTIALAADGETVGPWEIWRRDAVAAKSPRQPEVPRSERIEVFEIRFDWPLGRARRARRTSGRLHPFARVPVVLDGERRGTLVWRMWSFGRWSVEDGTLVLSSPALAAPTEVVHLRHGPM